MLATSSELHVSWPAAPLPGSAVQSRRSLRIAVGIPTSGRAEVLAETLRELQAQTRKPDRLLVCAARPADVATLDGSMRGVEVFLSAAGLTRLRNRILDAAEDCDLLVFFDDDFLPRPTYLAGMEALFAARPGVAMATGRVLADGACNPGLSCAEGRAILRGASSASTSGEVRPVFSAYGCNMALRAEVARENELRFDERLPLYGWQEDADFSRRISRFGEVVEVVDACGVHLGVKGGRTSGLRLGYSQVVNPLYIARRTELYPLRHALRQIARNMAANGLRALKPEAWVDRRGRLRGNLTAVLDVLRGRLDPEKVVELGRRERVGRVFGRTGPMAGAARLDSGRAVHTSPQRGA